MRRPSCWSQPRLHGKNKDNWAPSPRSGLAICLLRSLGEVTSALLPPPTPREEGLSSLVSKPTNCCTEWAPSKCLLPPGPQSPFSLHTPVRCISLPSNTGQEAGEVAPQPSAGAWEARTGFLPSQGPSPSGGSTLALCSQATCQRGDKNRLLNSHETPSLSAKSALSAAPFSFRGDRASSYVWGSCIEC